MVKKKHEEAYKPSIFYLFFFGFGLEGRSCWKFLRTKRFPQEFVCEQVLLLVLLSLNYCDNSKLL